MNRSFLLVNPGLFVLPPVKIVFNATSSHALNRSDRFLAVSPGHRVTCCLCLGSCSLCFGCFDTLLQPVNCNLIWPNAQWSHLQLSLMACPLVTRSGTGKKDEHWLSKQNPSRNLTMQVSLQNGAFLPAG